MSRYEKQITVYKNGEGTPVAMRIKPEEFTDSELIKFAATRIFTTGDRRCISLMATHTVIFSEDYIKDVRNLDPDRGLKHVVDTAISMNKAISVFIMEKGKR